MQWQIQSNKLIKENNMGLSSISIQNYMALSDVEQCSQDILSQVSTEDLRSLWNDYVLSYNVKLKIFDEISSREPNANLSIVNHGDNLSLEDKKYPALGFLAGVYRLFSFVLIIVGVAASIDYISKEMVPTGVIVLLASLFFSLISYACAESIIVITDISSFAFRILKHIKDDK
jgi:hypothetical protein